MGLIFADNLLGYLQTYRVLWLRSRYGSGKTALAFRLAYELKQMGAIRYIISNCHSPWCDNPADVVLVNGQADVCLILDEAGMFMDSPYEAKQYIAYMRKLNVVMLLASVMSPATIVRFLSVKRRYNLMRLGVPAWVFSMRLLDADTEENESFIWWNPAEIFGCYDTAGFPSSDAGIKEYILKWTNDAAKYQAYELSANSVFRGGFQVLGDGENEENGEFESASNGFGILEEVGRLVESNEEATAAFSDALPSLRRLRKKGGR